MIVAKMFSSGWSARSRRRTGGPRVAPTSKARNGDTVRVAFDPHKVHLFDVETELTILN